MLNDILKVAEQQFSPFTFQLGPQWYFEGCWTAVLTFHIPARTSSCSANIVFQRIHSKISLKTDMSCQ